MDRLEPAPRAPTLHPSFRPWRRDGLAARPIVCLDFDGTITLEDVLHALVTRHARNGWQEFERRWQLGEITSLEAMRGELAHVDLAPAALAAFFDTIPVDPALPDFVAAVAASGAALLVLSDGLDLYVRRILDRAGAGALDVLCNRAWFDAAGRLELAAPYPPEAWRGAGDGAGHHGAGDGAGNWKAHHVAVLRRTYDHVALVGDGFSDRGAARAADVVFAKAALRRWCEQTALPHIGFTTLADLVTRA